MEIVEVIQKIIAFIPGDGWGAAAVVAGMVDFLFRLIPSEKPIGVMHVIAGVVMKLGELLMKVAKLMDKILPQKVLPPK